MECLDAIEPAPPVRYDPRTLTRSPAFWRGALAARDALDADPVRTTLVHRLLAAAEAGRDATDGEDYASWLGYDEARRR